MADEKVEYSFQCDVSSLKNATESAIKLLNKYQQVVAKATSEGRFNASARATQTFGNAINKTIKDVDRMAAKLKQVGDVKLFRGSEVTQAFESTMGTISRQMDAFSNSTKITTKDVTQFKSELNSARSSITGTSDQIDKLVSSELKFQTTLGNVKAKADQFRTSMDNIKSRVGATFEPMATKVQGLGKMFDSIKSKIQGFKDRAAQAFTRIGTLASAVASAFRRTSTESDKGDASARRFAGVLNNIKKAMADIKSQTTKASSGFKSFLNTLKNATTQSTRCATSFRGLSSVTRLLSKTFTILTGITVGDWLSQATKESINYIENLNLFTVAMGDAIDKGREFVDTIQELYGMDPSNVMRYAGNFYQLASAIEMPEEAATNLSLTMTKAANDISSLFNVDIDTVFENLSSGMQGMARAVRKYGMDIRSTTLQQTALTLGITDSVSAMSEANRMGLRFLTMMKQASKATGDFARTIETPANQLKILKEQITQLGRAIGNFFITPLSKALAYINGFIMALRTALTFISSTLGLFSETSTEFDTSSADAEASAISGIGEAASDAKKKMQDLIAPFDELNVLQESTSGGAGGGIGGLGEDVMDPRIAEAIAQMEVKFENIRMKANEVRDALLEFFGFEVDLGKIIKWDPDKFEANLIEKFPKWTKTIKATFDNWTSIIDGFKKVFGALGEVFDIVKEKLKAFIGIFINDDTVSTFISNLADNLDRLATWISNNAEPLANLVITLGALWAGFQVFKNLAPILEPIITFLSSLSGVLTPLLEVVAVVAAVAGAMWLLYTNSEAFATSFDNLLGTLKDSLKPMLASIQNLFRDIWSGLQKLWNDHIKPMISKTGDALAPVLDTLGVVWTNLTNIIANIINTIDNVWNNTLQPVLGAIIDAVGAVMDVFKALWENAIGPVIEHVADGLSKLWSGTISPIVEKILSVVGKVIELVMALWTNVLAPIVTWIIGTLGPSIANIVNTIWDIVSGLFSSIGGVIEGLLTMLEGIIDFLVGVFTGDWDRAWKGIVNIFIGLGNSIISAFEFVVNAIIGLINGMISLVYNAVVALINAILGAVEGVSDLLGFDLSLRITAPPPAIPTQSWKRIPELATGGVVTSPTYLLAGEGAYSEGILPLDNSPQMQDLIQKIADAVDNKPNNTPVDVRVFIGDKEWDTFTYESAKRGEKNVGEQPVEIGG